MDSQKWRNGANDAHDGYASYGEEAEAAVQTRVLDVGDRRAMERDIILQEYALDRDAILMEIKAALRERRYRDAQEFVYKYRAAARTDESFAALARMTAEGLEKDRNIETLVTMLEATPEDEYRERLRLCREILAISPDHPKYLAELRSCQNKIGHQLAESVNPPKKVETKYTTGCAVYFGIMVVIHLLVTLGMADQHSSLLMWLLMGGVIVLLNWLLSCRPSAPFRTLSGFLRGFLSSWIWLFAVGIVAIICCR